MSTGEAKKEDSEGEEEVRVSNHMPNVANIRQYPFSVPERVDIAEPQYVPPRMNGEQIFPSHMNELFPPHITDMLNMHSNYFRPPMLRRPPMVYHGGNSYALSDSDDSSDSDSEHPHPLRWNHVPVYAEQNDSDEDQDGELAASLRQLNLMGSTRPVQPRVPMQRSHPDIIGPQMPMISNLRFTSLQQEQEEADVKRAIEMSLEQYKMEKAREEIQKNYAQELERKKAETEVSDDSGEEEEGDEDYAFYCADVEEAEVEEVDEVEEAEGEDEADAEAEVEEAEGTNSNDEVDNDD